MAVRDQASGLRNLNRKRGVRVLAVSSGKGGVGKTNVSVNLAVALSAAGQRVVLMDADLGMANVDVLLGLRPEFNLQHVFKGERRLQDIMVDGPEGLSIIPASSGISKMAGLSSAEHMGLIGAFDQLAGKLDVLIVDTAAGISDAVLSFASAAQDVIVVVCDEPASITDAYALVKVLCQRKPNVKFQVLANMVRSADEGLGLFKKLATVCHRFLDVKLHFLGSIPHDELLRKAVRLQRAVVDCYPGCQASLAFKRLAKEVCTWPIEAGQHGGIQFFLEHIIAQNTGLENAQGVQH